MYHIKKTKKSKKYILISVLVLLAIMVALALWGNTAVKLTEISVESKKIPDSFHGFKIAHVSDLHDVEIGEENERLVEMLKNASPDIIAITGDLVDCNRVNIERSVEFVKKAMEIAPCYYVSGNHEAWLTDENYQVLIDSLSSAGVIFLDEKEALIEKDGEKISISGVSDPDFSLKNATSHMSHMSVEKLKGISDFEGYKILLSHRPEYFQNYVDAGFDLVLSGHAHGGQVRMPFVGGLVAPNQGLFPEYDGGLYFKDNTNMIVSRGIGNSVVPLRINNRPEIVLITLEKA